MKLVVLTTETPHHAYFVRELAQRAPIECVVLERPPAPPPFETRHEFETRRDAHELRTWFGGQSVSIGEFARVCEAGSVNERSVVDRLRQCRADVTIVFGTGRLMPDTIAVCGSHVLNLHGGDPEEYRGLDSHLWAIYHRDWPALVTTLHRVSERLDTGAIVSQAAVVLRTGMQLHELRQANTETCLCLALDAIRGLKERGHLADRPQRRPGRYYSHMPAVLKSICVERFERRQAGDHD